MSLLFSAAPMAFFINSPLLYNNGTRLNFVLRLLRNLLFCSVDLACLLSAPASETQNTLIAGRGN